MYINSFLTFQYKTEVTLSFMHLLTVINICKEISNDGDSLVLNKLGCFKNTQFDTHHRYCLFLSSLTCVNLVSQANE